MKIPILNLYYLISYASGILNPDRKEIPTDIDSGYQLYDLYARLLINGLEELLRRGLYRQYVSEVDEIPGIRGRLIFAESLRKNSFRHGRAVCAFDDLDVNIQANRILKSAGNHLLRNKGLNKELGAELRMILRRLGNISDISLVPLAFRKVTLNRNMTRYRFLLFIAKLIMEHSSVSEDGKSIHFIDLERNEQKLARVFEAFVRNFYRSELKDYKIASRTLKWSFTMQEDDSILPKMETDIPLESSDHIYIIDTKYYASALVSNQFNTVRTRSGHMYQMFAYMEHYPNPSDKRLTGILLYPRVDQTLDQHYSSTRNDIHAIAFRTLDLMQPWPDIRRELLAIIDQENDQLSSTHL